MAKDTRIAWCKHTFNPWWGCVTVSRACNRCYANTMAKRYGFEVWGPRAPRRMLSDDNWAHPLKWDADAMRTGEFTPVFCASMADVFETHALAEWQETLDEARARLWALIEQTPHLTWLLLTKRPENVMSMIPESWRDGLPSNVWVGTTAEDQGSMDARTPHLAKIPTVVRWISVEPQVEEVDISPAIKAGVTWVITGGESGPGAQPYNPDWARSILRQCRSAGIATMIKQMGEVWGRKHPLAVRTTGTKGKPKIALSGVHGDVPELWPLDLRVREWPAAPSHGIVQPDGSIVPIKVPYDPTDAMIEENERLLREREELRREWDFEPMIPTDASRPLVQIGVPAVTPPTSKKGYAALPFEKRSETAKKAALTRKRRQMEAANGQ